MKGADITKLLLSLVVVWIHTGTNSLYGIAEWVVPIFFFFSGYFLFAKIEKSGVGSTSADIVFSWIRKTVSLYLTWTVIYLPFAIYGFYLDGLTPMKAFVIWVRNVVFVGENFMSWPLWYLLGMIQAGCIIWFFEKINAPFAFLCLFAMLLYIAPKFIPFEQMKWYVTLFRTTRNGFFIGMPFMVLGGVGVRTNLLAFNAWKSGTVQHKIAMQLRFLSIHIYLTHMLWAEVLILSLHFSRGLALWTVVSLISMMTGLCLLPFEKVKRTLYGRPFSLSARS